MGARQDQGDERCTGLYRDRPEPRFSGAGKVRNWLAQRIPTGAPGSVDDVSHLVAAIFAENIGCLTGETIYIDGAQGINH